jgi:branched-chain amino acid transport system ATP-binding protein
LGYVPEGRGILGRLTVEENLRLGLAARRDRRPWHQDLADVLEVFPALSDRMPEIAASLSGGQQQMLAIGRALVARPRLLMIDELSFGLAPVITQQIMDAIELLRQRGQTFLLVEQDASVLRASDRTYVLAGGTVALQDRSENLLSRGRDRLATVYLGNRSSL